VETDVTREARSGEEGFRWIYAVRDTVYTYDSFRDSDRFMDLDISLASALKKIMTGDLGREVMNRSTAEASNGRILRGRMILRMIYDWYRENSEYSLVFDINDLFAINLDRHGSLSKFKAEWDATLLRLRHDLDETTILKPLFYERLRRVDVFSYDMANYDRLPNGHPSTSYRALCAMLARYLGPCRPRGWQS
jgi:hypothetical protein